MREFLKFVRYEPETGLFRWIKSASGRTVVGEVAGFNDGRGYVVIKCRGRTVHAHRLAWFVIHGDPPPPGYEIDHRDLDRSNNRATNLRLATPAQNQQNLPPRPGRLKGISWHKRDLKWTARIRVNDRLIHLGNYDDPESAARAYDSAAVRFFGEFARTNFPSADDGAES